MSDAPWLTDPKYGGMSERSARLSYEAWERQGRTLLLPSMPPAPSPEEVARIKASVEDLIEDYRKASEAYVDWMKAFRVRQPKGFRAKRLGKTRGNG